MKKPDAPDALLISPVQAAHLIGVSRSTLYALMDSGDLPYALVCGHPGRRGQRRIRRADVDAYIKRIFAERRKAQGQFLSSVI